MIRHNARVILSCERVILNFLQRLSGIATLTRKFVDAVSGTKARILIRERPCPACACSINMRCVAAAAKTIGWISLTAC